jgi:hypothetical protein
MDEVNPSITEEKLKACLVAIYVTRLGIGHWALGIGHWAWGIGHGALGMGHWAWGIGHGALGIGYSHLPHLPTPPKFK